MTKEPGRLPNEVIRDKNGVAQGITARCHLCGWGSSGHFSNAGASAAKDDHLENIHGQS